jgi:hypothetical protein
LAQDVERSFGLETFAADSMPSDAVAAESLFAHLGAIVLQAEVDVTGDVGMSPPFRGVEDHFIDASGIATREGGFTEAVLSDE